MKQQKKKYTEGGENKCIEWLRYLKKTGGDNMHTDTLLQEVNT